MSQHDFEIANQGFPAFRSDLNSGLQALASNSAGATEPSTTYAYQFWYDETTDLLKMRNGDDDAWITLAFFDQTNDEWEVRSAVIQAVDSAGVVIKTDDGNTRISVADDGTVSFNDGNITNVGTIDVDSIRGDADTNTSIDFDGSDVITFNTGGSEAARIDSSGNVGIGTSSPTQKLDVEGQITISNGSGYLWNDGTVQAYSNGSYLRFRTASTDRLAIDSSGNLLFATTSTTPNPGITFFPIGGMNQGNSAGSSGFEFNVFRRSGVQIGSITQSGTTGVGYNTSSDYRLKEDIQPMEQSIERVKALNPVNFAWKLDGTRVDGFLAHEAQEVVPEAVTGEKDAMTTEEYVVQPALGEIYVPAVSEVLDEEGNVVTEAQDEQIISSDVERPETLEEGQEWRETTPAVMGEREVPDYQGIDQAKIVPLLTAALQDAIAKIEALEARVEALES